MTTIPALPAASNSPQPTRAPSELVGSGNTSTRWLGGLVGAGLGLGTSAAIQRFTSSSSIYPIRLAGIVGSFAAVPVGAIAGQHLLGKTTRLSAAETERELLAKQHDISVQVRQMDANAAGRLDRSDRQRIADLRAERIELAESKPKRGAVRTFALPAALAVGVGVASAALAHKLTPAGGNGYAQAYNSMAAAFGGSALGIWTGAELGSILVRKDRIDELPTYTQMRIDAIDNELDSILGPAE